MSRTHHNKNLWRIVKNAYYKKILHIWGEDFYMKRKNKQLERLARKRQKEIDRKEIKEYDREGI